MVCAEYDKFLSVYHSTEFKWGGWDLNFYYVRDRSRHTMEVFIFFFI